MNTEQHPQNPIRVLIVEDHKILAETYGKIFAEQAHISVLAHLDDREAALDYISKQPQVDLILMDLFLGIEEDHEEPEGLKTCREIKKGIHKNIKIIIVTSEIEGKWIWKAYDMGVEGYVPKKEGSEKLLAAIARVHEGKRYYKDEVEDARDSFHSTLKRWEDERVSLTKSEKEILELTSRGFTTADIAKQRNCVVGTVDIHKNHIFKKLGVANAPEAVRIALENGLI